MMSDEARFSFEVDDDGVSIRLSRERRRWLRKVQETIAAGHWPNLSAIGAISGVTHLQSLIDADDGRAWVLNDGAGFKVSHSAIAAMTEVQSRGLGLPPAVSLDLRLITRGHIGGSEYSVLAAWLAPGGRPVFGRRVGAMLDIGGQFARLPEHLYSVLEAVDFLHSVPSADHSARVAALASLRALLPPSSGNGLSMEAALEDIRLSHATAFSLRVDAKHGDFSISPVLFNRRIQTQAAEGRTVDDAEGVLSPVLDAAFQQRFTSHDTARSTYVLEQGTYVYIDPALRPALSLVRRAQLGSPEERLALLRNPQAVLKAALLDATHSPSDDVAAAEAEAAIDHLFIETRQFSDRVTGLGLWRPPALPKMARPPNEWRPETFAFLIQGKTVLIEKDSLSNAIDALEAAILRSAPSVAIGGQEISPDRTFLATLKQHLEVHPDSPATKEERDQPRGGPFALLTRENFLALDFIARFEPRLPSLPSAVLGLKAATKLLPHQDKCLEWLRKTYAAGWPGVLLADDMGLGKTIQALAFLSLLREAGIARRGSPILIVAPVGLLHNWRNEHAKHLAAPGLGERAISAWGNHLKPYRIRAGTDAILGEPALDTDAIANADWVLTTYETLRDYQASFGPIPFSIAVFDEIQKAKNPGSRLTAAVRAVNADFRIGLAGTPVENGLADLWTVMDCLAPGFLGDLRAFLHSHPEDNAEAQSGLASRLLEPTNDQPPPVLRRLKSEILSGLPQKRIEQRRRSMPIPQAERYAEIANDLSAKRIPILTALHGFRSSSLHPWHPGQASDIGFDAYQDASARLQDLFAILDVVASRREKALVFLESIDMQPVLAEIVRRRYSLKRTPLIINGQVSGLARQRAVDEFQSESSVFDVMLLSPRAGGVGLTLTSANHVVHLSRWWNPAVEDQCTDRVYRIGQTRNVTVYLPLAEHPAFGSRSYDLVLDELLDEKRSVARGLFVATEIRSSEFAERMDRGSDESEIDLDGIDRMEPLVFEAWVAQQARKLGLEVQPTPRSHDGGADLIFRAPNQSRTALVQCKHRGDPTQAMDEAPLDDLARAVRAYRVSEAVPVAITNAERFTAIAQARAKRMAAVLVCRSDLATGLQSVAKTLRT